MEGKVKHRKMKKEGGREKGWRRKEIRRWREGRTGERGKTRLR